MIHEYINHIKKGEPVLPAVVNEDNALRIVSELTGIHVTTLSECQTGLIDSVFLYQKADDKKSLSITDIRRFISDVSEKPYQGFIITLIDEYDTASREAMNASLKILEEPPEYAVILLIAKHPESLLETVRSRTIRFHSQSHTTVNNPIDHEAVLQYYDGKPIALLKIISKESLDNERAYFILRQSIRYAPENKQKNIENAIIALATINETPKNILERVFL